MEAECRTEFFVQYGTGRWLKVLEIGASGVALSQKSHLFEMGLLVSLGNVKMCV